MFKVQSPIIHSYTSSSSSSLPLESKLQTGSFLKKSTTNFSLKSLDSNGAISNSNHDSFTHSKDSFGDKVNEGETVMIYVKNNNGTFDKIVPDSTKNYTYFFRNHKVTYSDYVKAEYATLNDDYFMLDYIDNKYKNKNY